MRFWIDLWTWFFFGSVLLFAGMSVTVWIGGFCNIRTLLRNLRDRRR